MSRRTKDWLKSYLKYTALSESPEIFHFWVGVSTIAGALRRRVWIDQRYFEWTPNFYIILISPAGVVNKSTSIGIGMNLLREVPGIKFGPDSGTWQAIGKSLMEAQELIPRIANDLEGELDPMSCITCAPGEFGTFIDFRDRKLIDTLTSLWDGQRGVFEHKTATAGIITINNPWLNIISGTTPSWLAANVPEEAIGAGFASRVIFVFAEKKRHLIAYPGLMAEENIYQKMKEDLLHDLQDIAEMQGEMILTPDAVEWGTEWYKTLWNDRPTHMASHRFDGYIARKQTHVHKLAMVISAARSSSGIVEISHLQDAEKIVSAMEHDMIRVFESIGVAPMSRLMKEVLSFLHTYQKQNIPVTQQMLARFAFQIMSEQELGEVTNAAAKANYITLKQEGGKIFYHLNVDPSQMGKGE